MNLFNDPVFLVETAMLASLLAVGFYTSYTDLKARWVPNRYTLALLGIGLIGQAAMVALDVTTFGRVVALLGIGLAVAVGLTLFGFWAPGDAKLFWAAVAALPPEPVSVARTVGHAGYTVRPDPEQSDLLSGRAAAGSAVALGGKE